MSDKVRRSDFGTPLPERRSVLTPSRERRVPSAAQIARRQRLMRLLKLAMPLLAAGLLATLLFWREIDGNEGRLSFRRGPVLVPEALQLVAPRFQGLDDLGRPYTVTARVARQPGQEQLMLLDRPQADIVLNDGAWIYAESENGRYHRPTQLLELEGDVRIYHDSGVLFRTEAAAVQIDAGSARGERTTRAQGSFGNIISEGFEMTDRGAVMVFTGRAHAVLEGRPQ